MVVQIPVRKKDVPQTLNYWTKFFIFDKELFLIYTTFPIGQFAERMKELHPEWEKFPREMYNPRRWQSTARKEHREELKNFLEKYPLLNYTSSPEAHGVNVTNLMKNIGINLNWVWPPEHNLENITYIVSIGGNKK